MNQIQIRKEKEMSVLDKAQHIVRTKRIHRSANRQSNRNIWMIQSENPQTPTKFYCVKYDEDLEDFLCDCKAYTFAALKGNYCKHIMACCIKEGSPSYRDV